MPLSPDHQLGLDLRVRRPAGVVEARLLESMLKDLVGSDQSLMSPLLDLVARPAFLALDPNQAPAAERLQTRRQLIAELAPVYVPGVLERLESFLDGYLDHGDLAAPAPEPVPVVVPAPASTPSQRPGQQPGQPRALIAAGAVLIGVAAIGLASNAPTLCRQLKLCGPASSPGTAPATASADLDAASRAATAVSAAPDLPSLERALTDLEGSLKRLSATGLSGDQIRRRDQLQATARDGRERLERERSQVSPPAEPAVAEPQPAAAVEPAPAPPPPRPAPAPARRPVASSTPRPRPVAPRPRPTARVEDEGSIKPVAPLDSRGVTKPVEPLERNQDDGGTSI